MARTRTKDEILDQLIYAIACVARHYGPGLSADGLKHYRDLLARDDWWCDATWTCDVLEDEEEPNPDFHPSKLNCDDPEWFFTFEDVVRKSRTGQDD